MSKFLAIFLTSLSRFRIFLLKSVPARIRVPSFDPEGLAQRQRRSFSVLCMCLDWKLNKNVVRFKNGRFMLGHRLCIIELWLLLMRTNVWGAPKSMYYFVHGEHPFPFSSSSLTIKLWVLLSVTNRTLKRPYSTAKGTAVLYLWAGCRTVPLIWDLLSALSCDQVTLFLPLAAPAGWQRILCACPVVPLHRPAADCCLWPP